jgi:hypothetical protein
MKSLTVRFRLLAILTLILLLFSGAATATRLMPQDLTYAGAFRLPPAEGNELGWSYGGEGMTYYPAGDPSGPDDGYPGSLYGIGNDILFEVSEVSIPAPVISTGKNPDDLNTATTLQGFSDVLQGMFRPTSADWIIGDIEYLPRQGSQSSDKLYLVFGEHFQWDPTSCVGWCELSLSRPDSAGPWLIGNYDNFATNDYLFEIPASWADQYTPGLRLATGRYRDGSLGGSGPALFAIGPWNDGNPPPSGATLTQAVRLLQYGRGYVPEEAYTVMQGYNQADYWEGAAWVTSGDYSAVLFSGTKGRGSYWYGFANGVVWPDEPPYPEVPDWPNDDRGWWADSFDGVILFFDPDDLARVAQGSMEPWEPQPYAELDVDQYLYHITGTRQKNHLGAMSYDRVHGILYIFELFGDGDQPLVHVFLVRGGSSPASSTSAAGQTTVVQQQAQGQTTQQDSGQPAGGGESATQGTPLICAPILAVPVWAFLRRKK